MADVVIGAVLVAGANSPNLVSRAIELNSKGFVRCSANPTYKADGVIHHCAANMLEAVPLTSSQALNNAALPFGLTLAIKGLQSCSKIRIRTQASMFLGTS